MSKVNLDALIPREDFEITDQNAGVSTASATISYNDLRKDAFFLRSLRKPDFQRETNEWDPKKIAMFIETFLEGDLIPAIILWQSASQFTFIIDGSHRLSALAAWINDDYGDGDISRVFYEGIIPDEQLNVATTTRALIDKTVGPFRHYLLAATNPDVVSDKIKRLAKRLGILGINIQWVHGDSSKAESSFFKINQQAAPINPTELRVLRARKEPLGIAARAIVRCGKGHKYWSAFTPSVQSEIETLASDINKILFNPELYTPVKTLDVPIGGRLYAEQSLPLILDFINIINPNSPDIPVGSKGSHETQVSSMELENKKKHSTSEDADGTRTIQYLMRCKKMAQRLNSTHPGSLGLHPVVYFYSANGRHKIASFFAFTALFMELEKRDIFTKFIEVRESFEALVLKYDYMIQQIVRKYRSAFASYPFMMDFYMKSINLLSDGLSIDDAVTAISKEESFKFLTQLNETSEPVGADFSRDTKSAAFIRDALRGAPKCSICGGYLHVNSITIDHVVRKREGGHGSLENAQLTHPYCNTTFKN